MKNIPSCAECKNAHCLIKKGCSKAWLEKLSRTKYCFTQKGGQHIFMEGNPVFGIYFIRDGKVKVTSHGSRNKEQIVRMAANGHILGHRGFGGDMYPISAVALENTVLCFYENEILYDAFMENPKFTYFLMMFYSSELRKTEVRMKRLTQMSVREKTVDALFFIKDAFGLDKDNCLNVRMSREDICCIAGSSYGQIIRDLNYLKKDGLIDLIGKKIQLKDEAALAEIVAYYY